MSVARPTISVALIVKNEAENLAACLETVQWADEIIVMDSGSTDDTQKIAEAAGAKFYSNAQWPGFGKQRQLAQEKVTSEWVFWIDADERVTPELRDSILEAITTAAPNTVFNAIRLSWVFGKFIRHCGWYPDKVVRLYPTSLTQYNDSLVHEHVLTDASMRIEDLKGDLLHYTYRDLEHYLVKSASYANAWATQRQQQGKTASIFQAVTHGISCFIKMYFLKAGFLDGKQGFVLSALSAHSTFAKYIDLWIKTKTQ